MKKKVHILKFSMAQRYIAIITANDSKNYIRKYRILKRLFTKLSNVYLYYIPFANKKVEMVTFQC